MVLEDPGQPVGDIGSRRTTRPDLRRRPVRRDFEPVTASTPKQREVLLEQVKAHVTAELDLKPTADEQPESRAVLGGRLGLANMRWPHTPHRTYERRR
jgi:hypothetical protein